MGHFLATWSWSLTATGNSWLKGLTRKFQGTFIQTKTPPALLSASHEFLKITWTLPTGVECKLPSLGEAGARIAVIKRHNTLEYDS